MRRLFTAFMHIPATAAWLGLFAAALIVSFAWHIDLPIARRIARSTLTGLATDAIRGKLEIETIDRMDWDRIEASGVTVYDPEGRLVIVAKRVWIEPELDTLLAQLRTFGVQSVHVNAARVEDGHVYLIDDGHGSPTLFSAFEPSQPDPSSPSPRVSIEGIEVHALVLQGELLGLTGLRANDVSAKGRMVIDEDGHVDVRIDQGRGVVVEPFGFPGHIDTLTGTISTRPAQGITLQASAHHDQERADVRVSYKADVLDLQIDGRAVAYETLEQLGFTWAEPLTGHGDARLRLRGPVDDLQLHIDARTAGGPLTVSGAIHTARGVTLRFETEGVTPSQLVPNAPDLTLKGSLDLTAPTDGSAPRLHAKLAALRYKGMSIPAIEADAVIEDDRVRIERAKTTAAGARMLVDGSVGFDGSLDLDVDATFPAIERDPNLSKYVENVSGKLAARVRVKTPSVAARTLDIRGKVVLDDLVYGAITARRVTLTGTVQGDPELPRLNVEVKSEDTSVMAYSLGDARFAMRGGPRTYQAEGEFLSEGQKTFYFSSNIAADRKGLVIQADPIELTVGESTWRGLARDLNVVHGDRVELGLLRFASRSQRLEAQAVVRQRGEDSLTAQLQNFDLAALRALIGERFPFTAGHADAMVEATGDVARPELLLQGAMRGGAAFDIEGIDALYSITYRDGQLELDSEVDVSGRGTLAARGTGSLDATLTDPRDMLLRGRYDLELSGTDFDLTLLPRVKDELESGTATGTLLAKGTLDDPDFKSKLVFSKLRVQDIEGIEVRTDVTYTDDKLEGAVALADARGELINAKGHLGVAWQKLQRDKAALTDALLHGRWKVSGETAARRLDQLPTTLPAEWALPIVVHTRFDLAKSGGPATGSVRFDAKPVRGFEYEQCGLKLEPEVHGKLTLEGGRTRFSFSGSVNGEQLASGKGDVDLVIDRWIAGETKVPGRVNVEGTLDFDQIERVPWLCKHGRGELHVAWKARDLLTSEPNATLKVTGAYFPRLQMKIGRRQVSVESCGKDPIGLVLGAHVDKQDIVVTGQTNGCRGGTAELHVVVPLAWQEANPIPEIDTARDTRIELDFQRAQLRPLLDRIPGVLSFAALATGRVTARGSERGVDYRGTVKLHDGKLYPIATGQEIKDLSATLIGNGTWAKIEHASATAGDGRLELAGGIGFERWVPKRLQLAMLLEDFPVQREAVDLAWLTGSGAITTDIGEDRARTAIKLHALDVKLPAANNRSLQALEDHPDITLTTDTPPEHPDIPYVLEFFLDGRRRIEVTRNDFDAEITTELAMSYQEPLFRVGGYVEFQRGTFNVFGKDFTLTRGSMHFDGTGEMNPEVNMVATHDPGASDSSPIVVTVTGTLAEPKVEFQSDSCPGDGAIVMLVSGRCPNQDTWTADPEADRNAFTAGIVGGILTLGAQRELGGLIPRISVESTGQGSQARVKAGFDAVPSFMRSLVQRVYIQGAVSTGEDDGVDSTQESRDATLDFLIELYFPHNIVGAGRFSPDHYWGLDVTWEP